MYLTLILGLETGPADDGMPGGPSPWTAPVPGEGGASSHTRESMAVAATSVEEASGGREGSKFSVSFPSIRMCPAYSQAYASWHKKPIQVVHSIDVLVVKLLKQALG